MVAGMEFLCTDTGSILTNESSLKIEYRIEMCGRLEDRT